MIHWLLSHWLLESVVGLGVLACLFPAVSLPILRWLLLTERGRYVCIVCIAAWGFLFLRNHFVDVGRAECMAEQAAATDRARADAADQVVKRDTASDTATQGARQSAADRSVDQNTRAARVEGIAHESRPPVPAVCPGPDPRLVRESQSATARIHGAEDRLRGLGHPARKDPR